MSGSPDLLLAALHWVEYVGLLGGLGSIVVRRLARNRPHIHGIEPPMSVFLGVAFLGGLAVITVQGLEAGVLPGWERVARVAAEGLAFVLCTRGIPLVAPVGALAAVLLPLASHAAALQPSAGSEFADAIHVLSAAMWAGGILALATVHPPGGWRGPEARALLARFGRVALVAFAITALTGVLRASDEIHDVSGLWTTSYGEVLALKSLGVGVMLVLSAVAWRRGVPLARAEAALAVLVVGATAVLAAFPTPH